MKAARFNRFGDADVLELVDVPKPVPGDGELLVRVRAAGVNFADTQIRAGKFPILPPLPEILGMEAAGTVEALGRGVSELAVGSRVAAPLFATGKAGGYAEYVVIRQEHAIPLPDGVSFAESTAMMMPGLTALNLVRLAPPRGKSVFVTAAAGGVGSLLIQLSRLKGATTVVGGVSTAAKREVVTSLGADGCVAYDKTAWPEAARGANGDKGFDMIYESVGGAVGLASLQALAPHGEMAIFGALNITDFGLSGADLASLIFGNQTLRGYALYPLLSTDMIRNGLVELFSLAAAGRIRIVVGGEFALEDVAGAHRALEDRSSVGKLVLIP